MRLRKEVCPAGAYAGGARAGGGIPGEARARTEQKGPRPAGIAFAGGVLQAGATDFPCGRRAAIAPLLRIGRVGMRPEQSAMDCPVFRPRSYTAAMRQKNFKIFENPLTSRQKSGIIIWSIGAGMAQSVEHVIGNDEVISSILITSSTPPRKYPGRFLYARDRRAPRAFACAGRRAEEFPRPAGARNISYLYAQNDRLSAVRSFFVSRAGVLRCAERGGGPRCFYMCGLVSEKVSVAPREPRMFHTCIRKRAGGLTGCPFVSRLPAINSQTAPKNPRRRPGHPAFFVRDAANGRPAPGTFGQGRLPRAPPPRGKRAFREKWGFPGEVGLSGRSGAFRGRRGFPGKAGHSGEGGAFRARLLLQMFSFTPTPAFLYTCGSWSRVA